MALRGTLEDMGIIDLIQFPHQGRRSGELIVVGTEHEARLYYQKGKLVHARMNQNSGQKVVVDIVDWTEGNFEFRPDVVIEEMTIEMDLHRLVMNALKTRDERKMNQARQEKTQPQPAKPIKTAAKSPKAEQQAASQEVGDPALARKLEACLSSADVIVRLFILDSEGRQLARVERAKGASGQADEISASLIKLIGSYPRSGINRVFMEDEEGTVVMLALPEQRKLVAIAPGGVSLGVVSINISKLSAVLEKSANS